jgi:hypothetical protein
MTLLRPNKALQATCETHAPGHRRWAKTMSWRGLPLALFVALIGCDGRTGLPDQSYTFPTAIIGVPVASQDEGERIKAALATFAKRHDLVRYRPIEEPFFAESNRRDPMQHLERQTMYNPRYPNDRPGWYRVAGILSPVLRNLGRRVVWCLEGEEPPSVSADQQ